MKKFIIFNTIRKELNKFESLFDEYVGTLKYSEYLQGIKGKMLRPAATIMAAKIGGEISEKTFWGAIAIELMHNATLVHDDVIDNADKRRDKDTFKKIYGNKAAILYGDYLLAKGLECVAKTNVLAIMNTIAQTTGEMCIGELDQLAQSGTFATKEQEYYDIIYKKTASLFVCSLLVGYQSSGNSGLEDMFRQIGYNLGMAFQIKDDLLDYDTSGSSGKNFGNDIREKKMTLPLIYAFANASKQDVDEMKNLLLSSELSDDEVRKIINFAETNGGIKYTSEVLTQFIAKAEEMAHKLPENISKIEFDYLCRYIAERKK